MIGHLQEFEEIFCLMQKKTLIYAG